MHWAQSLGGPLTALLTYMAFEEAAHPMLAWVALLPLLVSLDRLHRDGASRFAHGFVAGVAPAAAVLGPPWPPGASLFTPGVASFVAGIDFAAVGAWLALGAGMGIFALALGPALRARGTLAAAAAAPVLWTAVEVSRGALSSVLAPSVQGWLSLGYAVPPDSNAAQAAELIGVHGLSFAACASATALALACRPLPIAKQVGLALLGCGIPLLLQAHGSSLGGGEIPAADTPVALWTTAGLDGEESLAPSSRRGSVRPELVVWRGGSAEAAEGVGRRTGATILRLERQNGAGAAIIVGERPAQPPVTVANPPGPIPWTRGAILAGSSADFQSPAVAARLRGLGPSLLVAMDAEPPASRGVERHRATILRYRAIESRRWLVRASGPLAFVVNPLGEVTLDLRGIEGAGLEDAGLGSLDTVHARFGTWWEGALVLVVLGSWLAGAARRRGLLAHAGRRESEAGSR